MIAIAGPNGAGKTTLYRSHLEPSGLRFVNADVLADRLRIDAYRAAEAADAIRRMLVDSGESFIFETVFSDPAGDKLEFLIEAERRGYTVVLFFVGVDSAATSDERVSMRVEKGGHDVPREKLARPLRARDGEPGAVHWPNSQMFAFTTTATYACRTGLWPFGSPEERYSYTILFLAG